MKREVRSKSVGTKVSEAELRVLESRAERAGLTLSEWVRDVLLGSSVEQGTMAAERAILAEVLAMRTILLNFMLKVGEGNPIPEAASKKLIEWADANKMKRALDLSECSWRTPGTDTESTKPTKGQGNFLKLTPQSRTSEMRRRAMKKCHQLLVGLFFAVSLFGQSSSTVPILQEAALPMYPPIWRVAHLTGKVVVLVTVEAGRVAATNVKAGEPHLQGITVQNLKTWRFADDVNGTFTVTFTYAISGGETDMPTNPTVEMLPSLDVNITARPIKPTVNY